MKVIKIPDEVWNEMKSISVQTICRILDINHGTYPKTLKYLKSKIKKWEEKTK